ILHNGCSLCAYGIALRLVGVGISQQPAALHGGPILQCGVCVDAGPPGTAVRSRLHAGAVECGHFPCRPVCISLWAVDLPCCETLCVSSVPCRPVVRRGWGGFLCNGSGTIRSDGKFPIIR